MLLNSQRIDDIAQKLSQLIPADLQTLRADLQQNFRQLLQGYFATLDFVTREEFDAQANVLAKTRQKLETIQQQLTLLETQLLPPLKPPTQDNDKT